MIQITAVGRVTADLELKKSAKNVPYLHFDLAATEGCEEEKHTVFLPCWAFQFVVERMETGRLKGDKLLITGLWAKEPFICYI